MKLLPDSIKQFIVNRLLEISGITTILLSIFILISVASYSSFDPSILNLNNYEVKNIGGYLGASISEILIQFFGYSSILICIILTSWAYKLFFSKNLELFALNFLLLPITVFLLALFFEAVNLPISNGFIATQSLILINDTNVITNTYLNYSLITLIFIFFLISFYFTMGLKLEEWNSLLRFVWHITRVSILFNKKLVSIVKSYFVQESLQKVDLKKTAETRNLEPKIDFDSLRNEPVSTYDYKEQKKSIIEQQDEILFEENLYRAPDINFLSKPELTRENAINREELELNAEKLKSVLTDFKIEGEIIKVSPGPIVTMYELQPAPGIKASKIISLSDDIARNMSAMSARVAIIPGKNVIGIEIPNSIKNPVYLSELFKHEEFVSNEKNLILALGKDISGNARFANLENMPHLLIAGTTGSGKSVGINVMITSILYKHSPEDCKFILIDPKMLELSVYEGVPHLITPVVTDPKKAIVALKWVVREMESRYKKMSLLGVRNIENYNQRIIEAINKSEKIIRSIPSGINPETGQPTTSQIEIENKKMPFIVVVVDEMADLMMVAGKEIEHAIQRLSQMARAAGIHLIMATQRPSVDVITGTIKANFPSRISFQVSSKFDSRTILGDEGAERLLGKGDMLMMTAGGLTTRIHGPFISDQEIENIVQSLQKQGHPEYDEEILKEESEDNELGVISESDQDSLFKDCLEIIKKEGKASTSLLQRKLQIGYNRAARIIDQLEEHGYISPANHVGKREVNFEKFTN
jgi:S-DNA-T family DNA segregation ATPase FtsK/SpoIIIE